MLDLDKRQVLVVGLGGSGEAAAILCMRRGAEVTVNDSRQNSALAAVLGRLEAERAASGASLRIVCGEHPRELFVRSELIVLSPGVPPLPALDAARDAGVEIIGEVELGFAFTEAEVVVGITGTNGKSTTTSLAGAILAAAYPAVFVGGNLGEPLCTAVNRGDPAIALGGVVVLELSSFQLESVRRFRATVAALLNLSEDHLDRYADYDAYVAAKGRIFERQQSSDFAVVNADPGQTRARQLAASSAATVITFRSQRSWGSGAWYDSEQGMLCVRLPHGALERYPRASLSLPGMHNTQNALAALLIARLAGASEACCRRALATFGGLPHRMQAVGQLDGVTYYDDSKATNVGSVVGSLNGFERPVVLIAGGKDKGGDYGPLRPILSSVCTNVILIGAAAETMAQALSGSAPLHRAASLEHAVALAKELARPGDAVVLSPACSSYDMFRDYIERGQRFAAAVAAQITRSTPGA